MKNTKNKKDKNASKLAVALGYDVDDSEAPYVIAAGKGTLAEKIIAESKKNSIPQYEDEKLVKSLSKLDIGENIPAELYEAVAQVLIFVDKMDKLKSAIKDKN